MAIYISPHLDTVYYPFKFSLNKGVYKGLLDNMLGVIFAHSCILNNPGLTELCKQGQIKIIHSWGEESSGLEKELYKELGLDEPDENSNDDDDNSTPSGEVPKPPGSGPGRIAGEDSTRVA